MTNHPSVPEQSPGDTEQTYKIQFQYLDGSGDSGKGHSIVGVQTKNTKKIVHYLEWDSRRIIDSSSNIEPVEKGLGDSCVNCGYHRPSWVGEIFEKTTKGLTCLQLDRPDHHAQRTLPSDDGKTVVKGCICPHHTEQGSQEWYEKVIDTQKSFLVVTDGEIVYDYSDFSVTYGKGGVPKITPKY